VRETNAGRMEKAKMGVNRHGLPVSTDRESEIISR
jgi:hypothetical protein